MLSSGRTRDDARAEACGWLTAAPSLRFFYRLFLLLGATFVAAVLLTSGPADAADGSGPTDEVSVSSEIEAQPATEPATEPTAEPVVEPATRVEPAPTRNPPPNPSSSRPPNPSSSPPPA